MGVTVQLEADHKISSTTTSNMSESRVPIVMKEDFFDDPFFKSSLEDFNNTRVNMFKESTDIWKHFDEEFDKMEGFTASEDQVMETKKKKKTGWRFPMGLNHGLVQLDLFKRNDRELSNRNECSGKLSNKEVVEVKHEMDEKDEKDKEVICVREDKDKFEVSLDTSKYKPEDLKVSVKDRIITVEGKHEGEEGKKVVSRQFCRKYSLPAGTKSDNVVSNLSADGILVISAPKKQAITNEKL